MLSSVWALTTVFCLWRGGGGGGGDEEEAARGILRSKRPPPLGAPLLRFRSAWIPGCPAVWLAGSAYLEMLRAATINGLPTRSCLGAWGLGWRRWNVSARPVATGRAATPPAGSGAISGAAARGPSPSPGARVAHDVSGLVGGAGSALRKGLRSGFGLRAVMHKLAEM